ncbi:hypothetical protein BCR34DRAFT_586035 [Clohesyomyces aquaticus]|uniref:Uncharacterized protein n=1 Tax=Clohesyomyces aquaticus TaxID=1231657 RepID=A0A1Y1ZUU7_9PLEO|nr:hypothetical protein BCR34DRAFT_586035 [Clohesyomyces aquaticus]
MAPPPSSAQLQVTQAEQGWQLTKPAEWSIWMVSAAIKAIADERSPLTYASEDEGKMDVNKTMNFYEAHDEYQWPHFLKMNFDFNLTMRLRRALVTDVFVALQKNGSVVVQPSGLGTPESSTRGKKRTSQAKENKRAKRICQKQETQFVDEAEDSSDNSSSGSRIVREFMAEGMRELITRSGVDIEAYLGEVTDFIALADLVEDNVVANWNGPVACWGNDIPEQLKRKADLWRRASKSKMPRGETPKAHQEPSTRRIPIDLTSQTTPNTPSGGRSASSPESRS